jgi:NADPH-ferrihemoprotein reductase
MTRRPQPQPLTLEMEVLDGLGDLLLYSGLALAASVVAACVGTIYLRRQDDGSAASSSSKADGALASASLHDAPRGPLCIYFGSQTGTAESYAQQLAEEGNKRGFGAVVVDLADLEPSHLKEGGNGESAVPSIFVMATYGEGDPTDNAGPFMDWLWGDAAKDPNCLASLPFTVFGLGNRQYEHFNRTGKRTHEGLSAAGAQLIFEYGEGDDDGTLEDDFEAWRDRLWPALCERFGGEMFDADSQLELAASAPPFELRYVDCGRAMNLTPKSHAASSTAFLWEAKEAIVTSNRELRQDTKDGSTRHIELKLAGGTEYTTADNISVCPENPASAVERLCRSQGYDLEALFVLEDAPQHKALFPTPCTVREALTRYVDVLGVPRKAIVEHLVRFAQDPKDMAALSQLVSKEGREKFRKFVTHEHRTIVELICNEFPSLRIPLADLLHILPHLHPRDYTTSSSSSAHPSAPHLTVSVISKTFSGGRTYQGLCSSYLAGLAPGSRCRVLVRPSSFRLPKDPRTPVIMVGPGTGIAPMRAMLQEMSLLGHDAARACVLYFGCRSARTDFIYKEELVEFASQGNVLTSLRTAFSRDQSHKVYVQHKLKEDGSDIWRHLHGEGGYLYVCGGTAMGADVTCAILEMCREKGGMSEEEAKAFIAKLHRENRYVQELWS